MLTNEKTKQWVNSPQIYIEGLENNLGKYTSDETMTNIFNKLTAMRETSVERIENFTNQVESYEDGRYVLHADVNIKDTKWVVNRSKKDKHVLVIDISTNGTPEEKIPQINNLDDLIN